MAYELNYQPSGEVTREFLKDRGFFRGIRGPVGSGKSVSCCIDIFLKSCQQVPDATGKRRTRWAVVRNTNPQLKTTTIKTWLEWFPEEYFGKFNWSPPYTHNLVFNDVEAEVIFLALDKPQDVRKLLSLDLTGVFVNEAREVPKSVIDGCTMRVGRFPPMKDGGPTWYGVIADTNAPEDDHWWAIMSGEVPMPEYLTEEDKLTLTTPDNWTFYTQPPGLIEQMEGERLIGYEINKKAENIKYLPKTYYTDIIAGKAKTWINVYVLNKYGTLQDGKPVYPSFRSDVHVSKVHLDPIPGREIIVGMDFGLTPAAVFGQQTSLGQWRIIRTIESADMGAKRFAGVLNRIIAEHYEGYELKFFGDPTGDNRGEQSDSKQDTAMAILRAEGIPVAKAPSNDPVIRIESVTATLDRMVDGQPGLLVDSRCTVLIRGFEVGYQYKRLGVSGEARYELKPNKNKYSHVHDACQYMMLGGGEGRALISNSQMQQNMQPRNVRGRWDVFDSQRRGSKPRGRKWS